MPNSRLISAVLALVLLTGCVAMTPAARQTVPTATVLFSVVLSGEMVQQREAGALIVSIDGQPNEPGWQVAFPASARVPGHYTTFLVRLALPAGAHKINRLSAVVKGETAAAPIEIEPGMSFAVRAKATDYLGRIEVSSQSKAVLTDAYETDFPELVRAWPLLRKQKVARRAPQDEVILALRPSVAAQTAVAQTEPTETMEPAVQLDASAVADMPKQTQREFDFFLKSGYPRAFAVSASGATGRASGGKNVIGRALANCRHAQPEPRKSRCRLFALDDTLISSLQMSASAPAIAAGTK